MIAMHQDNKTAELVPGVHWAGVLDYDIVTFDVVMETRYGTTYNSYFIDGDKKAVIETVKESFWEPYIAKLSRLTDPSSIDYIVLNHTEPDHSGCLAKLLEVAPNAKVVGTGNAIRYLSDLMQPGFPYIIVKDGQSIDLGNRTLKFIAAPNLHWPDTMYTFLEEDGILFSCDSFGAHYCTDMIFDDQTGNYDEAFKYYFDVILSPFSKFMLKAIDKIRPLDIRMIATGHGPVLRTGWKRMVEWSASLAREHLEKPNRHRVFIPYVSAYQKTEILARKIAEGLQSLGSLEVDLVDIEKSSVGELDQKMSQSSAVIIGSTTINQNILLPVYKLFSVISPIRDRGKLSGAFGSFGWSGESREIIRANLENLKLEFFGEGVFVKFTPDQDEQVIAFEYGRQFGQTLLDKEKSMD